MASPTPVRLNGPLLRLALRAVGKTPRDLAAAIRLHEGNLSRALNGKAEPRPEIVFLIWKAFGERLRLDEIVNVPGLSPDDLPTPDYMPSHVFSAELEQLPEVPGVNGETVPG